MERPASWDDYERAVMAGRAGEVDAPGDDYAMSDAFRDWLVQRMRDEVLGDVGMAVLKAQPAPAAAAEDGSWPTVKSRQEGETAPAADDDQIR